MCMQTDQLSPLTASEVYLSTAFVMISGSNANADDEQTLGYALILCPVVCMKVFFPPLLIFKLMGFRIQA